MPYLGTPPASTGSVNTNNIADNAVTGAKFNADVISSQTALATEPADTDELLLSDNGVIKRIDYSLIKGGGKVLQIVSAFKNDRASTTSGTDVAISGMSATITPSATSSKVLILVDIGSAGNYPSGHYFYSVYRNINSAGASAIGIGTGATNNYGTANYLPSQDHYGSAAYSFLDSPSTTSSTVYQLYHRTTAGVVGKINGRASDDTFGASSSITLMEVGA